MSTPPGPVTHTLPAELGSFVGREDELVELGRLLHTTRLLTLVGMGGVGKTRLALRLATQEQHHFADGVWLVELAPLAEPQLVASVVAGVFGLLDSGDLEQPPDRVLTCALRSRNLLLVLDNCEHLVEACAELATSLLQQIPGLRILATSRESLDIPGELVWRVQPLRTPRPDRTFCAADLSDCPAVQLFVERAHAVEAGFNLCSENAPAIAAVCARLGGLPLALELAASRIHVLGVDQILERLDDTFGLLGSGSRGVLARQQTLRATLDWSHQLLTPAEQLVFRRLAVFAGGCELEAAEAVCGAEDFAPADVLPALARLVDKSLVLKEDLRGRAWYRLLEPIRQYALERLTASGEVEGTMRHHAEFYRALGEAAEPELLRANQAAWLDRLERNADNVRAVLEWSREQPHRTELGLRLSGALWRFWDGRGHIGEGRRWLTELLARPRPPGPTVARAKALFAAGWLVAMQDSTNAVGSLASESLASWRKLGDQHGLAWSVWLDGFVRRHREPSVAFRRGQECLRLARAAGDEILTPWALFLMGEARRVEGDLVTATRLLEEGRALEVEREELAGAGYFLRSLAQVASQQSDYPRAAGLLRERLILSQRLGDGWNIPDAIEGLAWIASAQGHAARAARLYGAAGALRESSGATLLGDRQARHRRRLDALRGVLGEADMDRAWADGRALSLEQGIALALADEAAGASSRLAAPHAPRPPNDRLTPRECEVALLLAQGRTNRQIAHSLVISERTAAVHVEHILSKLDLHSRWQVAESVAAQLTPNT